jgi:general L-amino acid transport system permease protein
VVQLMLLSGSVGLLVGYFRGRARQQADEAGIELIPVTIREAVATYGSIAAFVGVSLAIGARTVGPYLMVLGCVAAGLAGWFSTKPLRNPLSKLVLLTPLALAAGTLTTVSDLDNAAAYAIAVAATVVLVLVNLARRPSLTLSAGLLAGVGGFQALSGTGGLAWLFLALALTPVAFDLLGNVQDRLPTAVGWIGVAVAAALLVRRLLVDGVGLSSAVALVLVASAAVGMLRANPGPALRIGAFITLSVAMWLVAGMVDLPGIDWADWSGLQLNIVVAGAAIVLAFPLGLLLALARRSSLPVLRYMATAYIELIRGVPLISLLLMGQFFIGFFLDTDDPLSNITRATTAITMFSAAYIAEIVRGGLQSIGHGQTEAGQALGLSPAQITRLLVLPQALRNVIPAMVGQFISLFKDTSLLAIIGVINFLSVREIVHAQEAFRGVGIAETLVYVAFGFWAISFAMSRESQRLERRLGVGTR